MAKRRERSNSRDFVSSKMTNIIARITVGGILFINTVRNSHSLHDSILRYDATMENINLPINDHSYNDDDDHDAFRTRRRLREQQQHSDEIKPSTTFHQHGTQKDKDYDDDLDQTLITFLSESSIGRKKVMEFLIEQYVSPTTPDDDMSDKLDNAMEALSFLETDPEPIQVEGYPFLFVGSVGASLNHKSLHKMGITHVINWSSTARCNVFDDVEYMCIEGVRGSSSMQDHTDELEKAVDYIESVRLSGGKAMSHCWYGKNRSVTLLVAYLMKYAGMTAAEANDLIKKTRPQADPYWGALQEYSNNYLSSSKTNPMSSSGLLRGRNNSESTTAGKTESNNVLWQNEDQS